MTACQTFEAIFPSLAIAWMGAGFLGHVAALWLVMAFLQTKPLSERINSTIMPWLPIGHLLSVFEKNAYGLPLEPDRVRIAFFLRWWWRGWIPLIGLVTLAMFVCNRTTQM